jgi:PncC family amidohydrolase
MQAIVSRIHLSLIKNNKTLAVAESCTGGLVSKLLTDISGSSQYFILGVITYSNVSKETILNIPPRLITEKGAVSQGVAQKMAQSVRTLAKTDFGIGVTGIAGPTGGTPLKPVGTVFIAIDSKNKKICKKFKFTGNRAAIRTRAALKTLELLKLLICEHS